MNDNNIHTMELGAVWQWLTVSERELLPNPLQLVRDEYKGRWMSLILGCSLPGMQLSMRPLEARGFQLYDRLLAVRTLMRMNREHLEQLALLDSE